jgi:predicted NBD/HSP70 family sugar kinase
MTPPNTIFEELRNTELGGVAYKNLDLKKKILGYFANVGNTTITDLSKVLNISSPKTNELVTELIEAGLVKDYGKTGSSVGRRPNLYGLSPDSVFFLGVEVKRTFINIGLINFQKDFVKISERIPYKLDNTPSSLDELCRIINAFIKDLPIDTQKILGLGINLSGRINYKTGYSYSYFFFSETPLSKIIEEKTGIATYLENDSRAMAYGEFSCGVVTDEKNVLFVNIDHGIGLGLMIGGELYYGKSGFSGEFGHIPIFSNEIICHCGKKGCLETEASGNALIQSFKQRLTEGASSIITKNGKSIDDIQLADIIQAANKDDVLAIELIGQMAEKLGRGIALLINIFNPELIIIGGSLSTTGDYIKLPIKSAINKYSLSIVNSDTEIKISAMGERAGIMGACLLVRNKLFN